MVNTLRAFAITALVVSALGLEVAACGGDAATPGSQLAGAAGTGPTPVLPPTAARAGTGAVVTAAPVAGTAAPANSVGTPVAGSGVTAPAQAGSAALAAGSGAAPAAVAGAGAPAAGGAGGTMAGVAGAGGMGPVAGGAANGMPADAEKCYELRAHGQPMASDTSKYSAPTGETYTSFIFKAPWTTPVQGLRFRHLPDNAAVLHHWLLYKENDPIALDGQLDACALDGPTGFLCGQASTRELITGWAPGRKDFNLPEGVGLELPPPGGLMAVEFHYFNTTGSLASDRSGVEICVTSKFRPNTASVSWLGTETISVPGGTTGTASGTCTPGRAGMNTTEPIHVLYSWPHMHKLGTHLKSVVNRKAGSTEVMYDGEFNFESQLMHDSPLLLMPGDTVTTTCTFKNTTTLPVGFGPSTGEEMCFNFTYAWPAHALDNPGGVIGGAANTCLF